MRRDMELAAAKLASVIAESMSFNDQQIEEIQLAMIESCINAFEHSKSPDQSVVIEYIIRRDELELKVTDNGIGFTPGNNTNRINNQPDLHPDMRKRGWGLEIMMTLMDSVDIMSGENGTTITMIKSKNDSYTDEL
jgi:serine/threonine-protein kinase RsbW